MQVTAVQPHWRVAIDPCTLAQQMTLSYLKMVSHAAFSGHILVSWHNWCIVLVEYGLPYCILYVIYAPPLFTIGQQIICQSRRWLAIMHTYVCWPLFAPWSNRLYNRIWLSMLYSIYTKEPPFLFASLCMIRALPFWHA